MQLSGFCPMQSGSQINIVTNIGIPDDAAAQVPGIAYSVPDLDGVVRVYVINKDNGETVACMEADLSNTKSVYQPAVGWATAIIAGLGLVASGITSGLGHYQYCCPCCCQCCLAFWILPSPSHHRYDLCDYASDRAIMDSELRLE